MCPGPISSPRSVATALSVLALALSGACTDGAGTFVGSLGPSERIPEPIGGCTDPSADNFSPEATFDDGSCTWSCSEPPVDHWETVVYEDALWSYLVANSDPGPDWMARGFDGAGWAQGIGPVGRGDGDDATLIGAATTLYLRTDFEIANAAEVVGSVLHIDYDDAFVAYLNGVEVARGGIGWPGELHAFDQRAPRPREARMFRGGLPPGFGIDSSLLEVGTNLLALQVFNENPISDLSARVFLSVALRDGDRRYGPTPTWFEDVFLSSKLPIMVVDTYAETIRDEPKVRAHMGTIRCPNAERHYLSQPPEDSAGAIGIEFRGSSSQGFPKKGYGFETREDDGSNRNTRVLGLPTENDWVIHNPYSDKSLMRNALAYALGRETGRYAPRTVFFELVLDGEYEGLYVLTEKPKRDDDRVDIDPLLPTDIDGDELTGGYIVKIDKFTGGGGGGWFSPFAPGGFPRPFFQYHDPEDQEIMPEQAAYIESYVSAFEASLLQSDFADPVAGYRNWIHTDSFIDYMLVNELGHNVDGYRLSTFLHKDLDSRGGKLAMGPLWDFNLAFGNADYANAWRIDLWEYAEGVPFWWSRFTDDPAFNREARCRWEDLRTGPFSDDALSTWVIETEALLDEAQARNFLRWPVLGSYVWPNWFVGDTWYEEVDFLMDWVLDRASWIDSALPGDCP
jgi:hypothetical protein